MTATKEKHTKIINKKGHFIPEVVEAYTKSNISFLRILAGIKSEKMPYSRAFYFPRSRTVEDYAEYFQS